MQVRKFAQAQAYDNFEIVLLYLAIHYDHQSHIKGEGKPRLFYM